VVSPAAVSEIADLKTKVLIELGATFLCFLLI
jgi:hypothetical protein